MTGKMAEAKGQQKRILTQLTRFTEAWAEANDIAERRKNILWAAMVDAKRAGLTYGQITKAVKYKFGRGFAERYSRARVQQIIEGGFEDERLAREEVRLKKQGR